MSDDYKIYVDGSQPATLNDGAGALTDCPTLQEAVLAWQRLPPGQKIRATVKIIAKFKDDFSFLPLRLPKSKIRRNMNPLTVS